MGCILWKPLTSLSLQSSVQGKWERRGKDGGGLAMGETSGTTTAGSPQRHVPSHWVLWTGLTLNQIGQGLRPSPSDIPSIQGLIWQWLCLCHVNPMRLLIMMLIYQLHLWLSSLYISVCSLKSLWWESCLVILFSPWLCILERLAKLEKPSTTILTTFLLVSREFGVQALSRPWSLGVVTEWVNS